MKKIIKNIDIENIWIIDPIDGTTNFLHGIPHFAISIALLFEDPSIYSEMNNSFVEVL